MKKQKTNFMAIVISFVFSCILIYFFTIKNLRKETQLASKLSTIGIQNLKTGQKKMTNMLKAFDQMCSTNDITYFVIGGTLLGAVVYKGWIPWDGDIDIEILQSDWNKLNVLLKNGLPNSMWLQTEETDNNYKSWKAWFVMGKIRDLNSCYLNCQDGTKFHNGFMIDLNLFYVENNKVIMPDNDKVDYMEYEDVFPLKRVPFDDIMVNIPYNSEKYLKNNYGNRYYDDIEIEKRYPHEGTLDPYNTCKHHKQMYS